jgi:site-specific DNA recombinase
VQRNLSEGWVISKQLVHAALVSKADFHAAQDIAAPRGPAGPAVRRYLLAGLLACGRCGRRLESAWSNGKPAYRCRHGYTSAAGLEPGRSPNTYVREDQILPHLAAIAILLAVSARKPHRTDCGLAQLTGPDGSAALIDQLRAGGTVLTYDPASRTLRAGGHDAPPFGARAERLRARAIPMARELSVTSGVVQRNTLSWGVERDRGRRCTCRGG